MEFIMTKPSLRYAPRIQMVGETTRKVESSDLEKLHFSELHFVPGEDGVEIGKEFKFNDINIMCKAHQREKRGPEATKHDILRQLSKARKGTTRAKLHASLDATNKFIQRIDDCYSYRVVTYYSWYLTHEIPVHKGEGIPMLTITRVVGATRKTINQFSAEFGIEVTVGKEVGVDGAKATSSVSLSTTLGYSYSREKSISEAQSEELKIEKIDSEEERLLLLWQKDERYELQYRKRGSADFFGSDNYSDSGWLNWDGEEILSESSKEEKKIKAVFLVNRTEGFDYQLFPAATVKIS